MQGYAICVQFVFENQVCSIILRQSLGGLELTATVYDLPKHKRSWKSLASELTSCLLFVSQEFNSSVVCAGCRCFSSAFAIHCVCVLDKLKKPVASMQRPTQLGTHGQPHLRHWLKLYRKQFMEFKGEKKKGKLSGSKQVIYGRVCEQNI